MFDRLAQFVQSRWRGMIVADQTATASPVEARALAFRLDFWMGPDCDRSALAAWRLTVSASLF